MSDTIIFKMTVWNRYVRLQIFMFITFVPVCFMQYAYVKKHLPDVPRENVGTSLVCAKIVTTILIPYLLGFLVTSAGLRRAIEYVVWDVLLNPAWFPPSTAKRYWALVIERIIFFTPCLSFFCCGRNIDHEV